MKDAESTNEGERRAVQRALVDVLLEVRTLLALSTNRFEWSGWEDAEAALHELDELTSAVAGGHLPLTVLFAPTGPLQEVSISSGWGDEFLALADRWDETLARGAAFLPAAADARVRRPHMNDDRPSAPDSSSDCRCLAPPLHYRDFDRRDLGVDEGGGRFADVSIERCRRCGRTWLHYQYEVEARSGSGRWYRGVITAEQADRAAPDSALELLATLGWHLYGGSYFGTPGRRSDVPLDPSSA